MKINIDFKKGSPLANTDRASVKHDGINMVEITLENGQRFQLKEIAQSLQVRALDGYVEVLPRMANEIMVKQS